VKSQKYKYNLIILYHIIVMSVVRRTKRIDRSNFDLLRVRKILYNIIMSVSRGDYIIIIIIVFEHMFGTPSVRCCLRRQRWLAVSKETAHLYQWFLNDIKQTTSFVRNATTRIIYVLCPRDLQSSPNYLCTVIVVWFFFFFFSFVCF